MSTCLKESDNPLYMLFLLGEESGELMGKFSKAIRKGHIGFFAENQLVPMMADSVREEWMAAVKKELGDCLWAIAGIAREMGFDLEEVGAANLAKLASRKQRGVIDGSGDDR